MANEKKMASTPRSPAAKTPIASKPAAPVAPVAPGAPVVPVGGVRGQQRAIIDAVLPAVDGGRFAAKCVAGEPFHVEAHCFAEGHDALRVMLRWQAEGAADWTEQPMTLKWNDEWHARFTPATPGRYAYSVSAWVDVFESWRHELVRRVDPEDIRIAARTGALEIRAHAQRASGTDRALLDRWASELEAGALDLKLDVDALKLRALDDALADVANRYPNRSHQSESAVLPLVADRLRARYSTWYELFPRSAGDVPGRHGSFADVERRLPYVQRMGFDVLYFPPIHPVGREQRKGKNNALVALADDVGSPWAIGAAEGGHTSILPALGTAAQFRSLVAKARAHGMEIALDIAFQCAPDHPWVKEHPAWFRWRPDGSVQYAENPPKKYQDIYPFNFESDDWQSLWRELKGVFDHWIGEGVQVFRVDNPHTKAFPFWEWCIAQIKREHPGVIFLAEAFTRPKVMHRLAKVGYSQSYTYFTWRNTKEELTDYFTELASRPGLDYFRPNVWPNTPDILHEALQRGDRATYMTRLLLAATLSASYGIYGPAYELLEHLPRNPGSEEYLDSEKYQLRHWDLKRADSLAPFIAHVNGIRRDNVALQANDSLRFLPIDNEQLIAYAKTSPDGRNVIVCVVNLDPVNAQQGWLQMDGEDFDVKRGDAFQMHDLLGGERFIWRGGRHFIRLDPHQLPAHVMRLRRASRSEHDFDYFE